MTICVVGASGYIGSYLSKHFLECGYRVIGTYRRLSSEDRALIDIEWVEGDVSDNIFLKKLVELDFNYLVYCVSLNHFESELSIEKSINVNLMPFAKLCEALSKKSNFQNLIYFSTLQVLGKVELGSFIDNCAAPKPLNTYGLTHLLCEELISYSAHKWGLNATALRLSNAYGPPTFKSNDCWWLVINDLCLSALQKKTIILTSDGTPQRDFIHLKDVANSVLNILNLKNKIPDVVNLCSGKTYTILELANIISECYRELFLEEVQIITPSNSGSVVFFEHLRISFLSENRLDGSVEKIELKSGITSLLLYLNDNYIDK
ncbi:MAG: NAD(P)-dependent oxidoreductase [Polynucleobacter sp.]|nr:NAD(P)-dependent oxidoreductase [Polynucleobacter sp.]